MIEQEMTKIALKATEMGLALKYVLDICNPVILVQVKNRTGYISSFFIPLNVPSISEFGIDYIKSSYNNREELK